MIPNISITDIDNRTIEGELLLFVLRSKNISLEEIIRLYNTIENPSKVLTRDLINSVRTTFNTELIIDIEGRIRWCPPNCGKV